MRPRFITNGCCCFAARWADGCIARGLVDKHWSRTNGLWVARTFDVRNTTERA